MPSAYLPVSRPEASGDHVVVPHARYVVAYDGVPRDLAATASFHFASSESALGIPTRAFGEHPARRQVAHAHHDRISATRQDQPGLHEQAVPIGAARQRLNAERARSCKEVGDDQPLETADAAGEHREQCLTRAIGGGAGGVPLGGGERAAAPVSGDDPHQPRPRGGRPGPPRVGPGRWPVGPAARRRPPR